MKQEEIIVLGLAGLAVFFIVKGGGSLAKSIRGLSQSLQAGADRFGAAGGSLWVDTESAYTGTWTANGPLNLTTYDKQIYD